MDNKLGVNFIKMSLIYFGISVTIGAIMTLVPVYRFVILSTLFARAHAHLSLIGWVSISILGFIYISMGHINKHIYSERLGYCGFWLLNIGTLMEFVTLVVGGYIQACSFIDGDPKAYMVSVPYTLFAIIFAFVMVTGAYMTIYNIYKTLNTA